jgi:hypothetical protein
LDEFAEEMVHVLEWLWNIIICFLDVLKCDSGELNEANFQCVERPCEHIFGFLGIQEISLDEAADMMFKVGEWPYKLIICLLNLLKNNFREVDEAIFEGVERSCEIIFYILGI